MASSSSANFFENGTNLQFEYVLSKYQETLEAKAKNKSNKPETLIKLDKWYQNDLPKKIKSRGKEAHLIHDELVQTIKWKLARGVFRPRLKDLVQMNTPRVVMQETKKAFRHLFKKGDLEAAVAAMSNLKGVGPAMASAVLAAGAPELAPFMADECLLSMPGIEGIDYTMKEYMKLVHKTKECCERLNSQGGSWTPHKVELAMWTYYVAKDLTPELLEDMPGASEVNPARLNGNQEEKKAENAEDGEEENGVQQNGGSDKVNGEINEDSNMSADDATTTTSSTSNLATSEENSRSSIKEDESDTPAAITTTTETAPEQPTSTSSSSQSEEPVNTDQQQNGENSKENGEESQEEVANGEAATTNGNHEQVEEEKKNGEPAADSETPAAPALNGDKQEEKNGSEEEVAPDNTDKSAKEEAAEKVKASAVENNGDSECKKRPIEDEDTTENEQTEAKKMKSATEELQQQPPVIQAGGE